MSWFVLVGCSFDGINATRAEVRITNVASSATKLAAEALNRRDPKALYMLCAEQMP